jgi:N-hydroxyarylamine O-acetyltransferase
MFDLNAYFRRLGYDAGRACDADALKRLHRAHVLNVPFENLDIHRGRPITLDPEAHFRKVVHEHRGGFCYELNQLFGEVLRQMGFDVTTLAARVYNTEQQPGRLFAHLLLMVRLDERWLVDVAFGDTFLQPLKLDDPDEQHVAGRAYRLIREDQPNRFMLRVLDSERNWRTRYDFQLIERSPADFSEMCDYQQSSPESQFVKERICTRATGLGRMTMAGRKLIRAENGARAESDIADEHQFAATLREHFGIDLPTDGWTIPL